MTSMRCLGSLGALGLCLAAFPASADPDGGPWREAGCRAGSRTLFYAAAPQSAARLPAGFADSLWLQLREPAQELGYCLEAARDPGRLRDTARFGEDLYLEAFARDEGGSQAAAVAALRVRDLARGKLPEAEARPLVSLRFSAAETAGLSSVVAKKVAENLRSQYVAVLLIRSHPEGALVRAAAGPEGATPVEWVLPLGSMQVTLSKPGYLEARRELDLSAPGQHTYELQLAKRRFYHSKFIYPTLAAAALAGTAFALEGHYYGIYQGLGAEDSKSRPAAFGENFRTAKTYERLGYTALGLAWAGLALCFAF
jgi:hypothetical protein